MENKRTLQREASTKRILDAAVREFAEKGYAGALLGTIAKQAGVVNSILSERYGGKDRLCEAVFKSVLEPYREAAAACDSAESGFLSLVSLIQTGCLNRETDALFLTEMLRSRTLPASCTAAVGNSFENTGFYEKLEEAAKEGRLVAEDPAGALYAFFRSACVLTDSVITAGLTMPSRSSYLRFAFRDAQLPQGEKRSVKQEELTDAMKRRIYTDPLTGCLNRLYYQDHLDRLEKGAAAAFMDVDDFRSINDIYGHSVGDSVLKEIARVIRTQIRENDTVVRLGGDEFLMVLRHIPRDVLADKMNNLRTAVEAVRIPEIPELSVSVSIGCIYAEDETGLSFEEANRQMIIAKGSKNSVAIENVLMEMGRPEQEAEAGPAARTGEAAETPAPQDSAELMTSFVEDFDAIFTADLKAGTLRLYRASGRADQWIRRSSSLSFNEIREAYAEKFLHPEDKAWFLEETEASVIRERLESDTVYYVNHRILSQGVLLHFQLKIVRDMTYPDRKRIIFGIHSIDESRRNDIRTLEEEARQRQKAQKDREDREREQAMISGFTSRFTAVYLMDFTDRTLRRFKAGSIDGYAETDERGTYPMEPALERYVNNHIVAEDRERAAKALSVERIAEELKKAPEYSVRLRLQREEGVRYYKATALRLGDGSTVEEALLGFSDCHDEVIEEMVRDNMNAEYDSGYVLDMKKGSFRVLLRSRSHEDSSRGEERDFNTVLQKVLPAVDPEHRDLFAPLENMDGLRQYLKDEEKREFTFKLQGYAAESWWRCIIRVLDREDGEATLAVVLFAALDRISSEELDSRRREDRFNRIINFLTANYTGVYFADFEHNHFENYTVTDKQQKDTEALLKNAAGSMTDVYRQFVRTSVHPEDREIMLEALANARDRLAKQQSFSVDFRQNIGGEYLYTRMKVVKADRPEEPATAVALGFELIEDQMRAERLQEKAIRDGIRILYEEENAETAINALLRNVAEYHHAESSYICELHGGRYINTYEYNSKLKTGEKAPVKGLRAEMIPDWIEAFRQKGALVVDNAKEYAEKNPYVGRALKEMEVDRMMVAPIISDGAVTGYIGVDNPGYAMGEMMILRSMAALVHSEILRRKQSDEEHTVMRKLTTNFDVVSFVNLKNDYLRVYSIADKHRKRYGTQITYSETMDAYIGTGVTAEDRDRVRRMTSPEYVTEQLKKKDTYEVSFTDDADGKRRSYTLSYIKANEEGSCAVVCGTDNTAVVAREKERQRQQQRQLELTVEERTAELRERNKALDRVNEGIIELLGDITEARDNESGQHIRRVKGFTYILADCVREELPEYGLTENRVALMTSASALHDIGKIMIPDAILLKPGKLTKEEFEVMKSHSLRGYEILEKAPADWSEDYLAMSQDIARYHHEKWDGSGYPEGLKGDAIPISAQIVSVADCYDALTTKRVYKPAFSPEKAFDMILNGECGCYSEKLMACFRKCREQFIRRITNPDEEILLELRSSLNSESLSDMHILLAEDNELSMDIAREILECEGAKVSGAVNGEAAIRMFRNAEPGYYNAILMDVNMPGIGGIEATRAIRNSDLPFADTVPIIALTAGDTPQIMQQCLDAGMDSFLTKPINIPMLIKVLLDCMRNQSLNLRKKLEAAKMENSSHLKEL